MSNLNVNNFIKAVSSNDRVIYIIDSNGSVIQSIDPYSSVFYSKSNFVYILSDGKASINQTLKFDSDNDAISATNQLNSVKKLFIDKTNNQLVDGCSTYIKLLNNHTGDTSLHINQNLSDALRNATNPSYYNKFVTISDISSFSGDTKQILISSTDTTEGYIIQKLTGSTYLSIDLLNAGSNEILQLNVNGLTPYNLFVQHTGTTNPHNTTFSSLINTAHTHLWGDIIGSPTGFTYDLSMYSLTSHTHTWVSILNKPDFYTTAQTYSKAEVNLLVSNLSSLSAYTLLTVFNTHTGATNPHRTSFASLINTAHTHLWSNITNTAHTHNDIYFTKYELLGTAPYQGYGSLDTRYFTKNWIVTHYYDKGFIDFNFYTKDEIDAMFLSGITISGSTSGLTQFFYTKHQVDTILLGYSLTSHTHALSGLTDVSINSPNYQNILVYSAGTWYNTDIGTIADDRYVNTTGDTMTGDLNILTNLNVSGLSIFNNVNIIGVLSATTIVGYATLSDLSAHTSLTGLTNPHLTSFFDLTNTAHTHDWIDIYNTPTTISGYGITDAYTKTNADLKFVYKTGDTMTGDLNLATNLIISGNTTINNFKSFGINSINVDNSGQLILGNQYRNSINILDSAYVDVFPKTDGYSCIWFYSVRSGATNIRSGIITACWDDGGSAIEFAHQTTMDIGNTDLIDFVVNMDGGQTYVRLFAFATGNWTVKYNRMFI